MENLFDSETTKRKHFSSTNYSFSVIQDSVAEKDIASIIETQEAAFEIITQLLRFRPTMKINYTCFDSALDVAKQMKSMNPEMFPDDKLAPINGFAWYPDQVFCTYNEKIKAHGPHEDAHLLMYQCFGIISRKFLEEGIAVYFGRYWQGIDLHEWAKTLFEQKYYSDLSQFLEDEPFCSANSMFSYPVAGSFCKWIIDKFGFSHFAEFYRSGAKGETKGISGYVPVYKEFISNEIEHSEEMPKVENIIKRFS